MRSHFAFMTATVSLFFLSACQSNTVLFQPRERMSELTIEIASIRSEGGVVRVALYDSPESFMKSNRAIVLAFRRAIVPTATFVVRGRFAPGRYAVVAFHDENENGRLDTTKAGMPKEGIGASNITKWSGPPSWEATAFDIAEDHAKITVPIVYP